MTMLSRSTGALPQRIPTSTAGVDAIDILTEDHDNVKQLFEQFKARHERAYAEKEALAVEICLELTRHATAEEEIFYPAVRAADDRNEDLIDEAVAEHACAKELIARILSMDPGDSAYDASVKALSDQIAHHIMEEENDLFPRARAADLNLLALGAAIEARKMEVTLPGQGRGISY